MKLVLLWGLATATMYRAEVGDGLYCDQYLPGVQAYRVDGVPFVAMPPEWYKSGLVKPGEMLCFWFPLQEDWLCAQALDAGDFGPSTGKYVEQWGSDKPIIVDVPEPWAPFPGLSTLVEGPYKFVPLDDLGLAEDLERINGEFP